MLGVTDGVVKGVELGVDRGVKNDALEPSGATYLHIFCSSRRPSGLNVSACSSLSFALSTLRTCERHWLQLAKCSSHDLHTYFGAETAGIGPLPCAVAAADKPPRELPCCFLRARSSGRGSCMVGLDQLFDQVRQSSFLFFFFQSSQKHR